MTSPHSLRYLHFIVETLSSSLTRGYQVHVLGYTLHAVLVKTLPSVKSGEIDYCMGGMTPIIEEDILGETGEEKDVEGPREEDERNAAYDVVSRA